MLHTGTTNAGTATRVASCGGPERREGFLKQMRTTGGTRYAAPTLTPTWLAPPGSLRLCRTTLAHEALPAHGVSRTYCTGLWRGPAGSQES